MKHLKIKVWRSHSKHGKWHVRIEEQSHRNKDFGIDGDSFTASNKVTLISINLPEFVCADRHGADFFVRGTFTNKDFCTLSVTKEEANAIQKAVNEYNAYFKALGEQLDKTPKYVPDITHVVLGDGTYHYGNLKITCDKGTVIVNYEV